MENVILTHCWDLGMGLGHVTCKGGQLFFVDRHCLTFPPTNPRVFFSCSFCFGSILGFHFASWLVHVLELPCKLLYFVKLLLLLCE